MATFSGQFSWLILSTFLIILGQSGALKRQILTRKPKKLSSQIDGLTALSTCLYFVTCWLGYGLSVWLVEFTRNKFITQTRFSKTEFVKRLPDSVYSFLSGVTWLESMDWRVMNWYIAENLTTRLLACLPLPKFYTATFFLSTPADIIGMLRHLKTLQRLV